VWNLEIRTEIVVAMKTLKMLTGNWSLELDNLAIIKDSSPIKHLGIIIHKIKFFGT